MDTRTAPTPFDFANAAREAAYQVGPRVYKLTGIDTDPVRFFVIGCHGNGHQSQIKTAALMNQVAEDLKKSGEKLPSFILFLGDNIYDYGVNNPYDPGFNSCFHNVYYDKSLTTTNLIPSWMILGNHDVNMHAKAYFSRNPSGEETGMNQVAHTYISNIPENIQKKKVTYQGAELSPAQLAHWNMPYQYYSLIAGNTQIFCLDSNNYLKDYLDLMSGKVKNGMNIETGRANQAAWFQTEYEAAKRAGRQIFIAQHHPLFLSGKRSFPNKYDSTHYLTQAQIDALNAALKRQNPNHIETQSYNELLAYTYMQQHIVPDMVFAAHEHFMSYHNDVEMRNNPHPLRQFTSGGGGGELHERASYRGHPFVSLHQQHNGFGMVTCPRSNTNKFNLDVYTLEGLHLSYDESSHRPLVKKNADSQVDSLREVVSLACDRYFRYLKNEELKKREPEKNLQEKSKENASMFSSWYKTVNDTWNYVYYAGANTLGHFLHDNLTAKEHSIAQDIQAYFSQIDLPDLRTSLQRLHDLTSQLPMRNNEENAAFYYVLQNTVRDTFGFRLQSLYNAAGLWHLKDDFSTDIPGELSAKMV